MNKKDLSSRPSKTITQRLIPGLLLGVLVFVGLALLGDLRKVSETLLSFNWQVFPIALAFTLFNYGLRFLKWHYYLHLMGVHHIGWVQSLRLFIAGFPLAVTPGKVGEVLKGVWLKQLSGLPVARGISVVLAERISDGLAVLALSTLGVVAYPQYWPVFILILAALLLIVIISQIRPAALAILELCDRIPLISRFTHGLNEFYEGSYALFRPGSMLLAVLLGTVSWLGEGIGFYVVLLGLGLPPSTELMAEAIFILSFSTIVGAASALPGGLGAAEASIAGMLTLILSLQPSIATSATLLIRLATLWFGVGLGIFTWIFSADLLGFKADDGPALED